MRDWTLAMMRLNSREALDKVLREFRDTIDHQADKLDGLLKGLPEYAASSFGRLRTAVTELDADSAAEIVKETLNKASP